jgi:hypothetical protein
MSRTTGSYTGKRKHKTNAYIHVATGIIKNDVSVQAVEDRTRLKPGTVTYIPVNNLICTETYLLLAQSTMMNDVQLCFTDIS